MMVDDGLQGAGRGQSGEGDGDAWGVRRMEMRDLECVQRGEMEERGDGCTGSLGSASDGDEVLRLGDEMGCVMEKGRDGWRWNSRDDGEIRKKKVNVSGDLYGRPGVCVQMEMRFCV
ncbi:hypothetical protein MRB53_028682 [Persea americana]|uniref:Uncharacterized protein n=1 Tax=Persea americana TaxID=3435 RepID=A0ACC2KGE1_PERAE|nr:hypothetical protein MRB53_028682 [Persea americana]